MKSSNKTIVLFGVAFLVTLAAAGVYTFFFISMREKTNATAELSAKILELSGKESSLASSVSILNDEKENIGKLSALFFNESEIVAFTKKIEALGPQSGTNISIESLEPGLTEKTVPFLSFRVKATGKFADAVRLLVLLENFPGKFDWKTVRLVRDNTTVVETPPVAGTPQTKKNMPTWSVEIFLSALNFTK